MKVSILIATRNRAAHLKQTLDAMRRVRVPDGLSAELVVVDNGSTDDTASVVRAACIRDLPIRTVREPEPGASRSRNRGLAETDGELVLFIDDDVRPGADWIAGMTGLLIQHGPCGVAGGVRIAPQLERPWMTPLHRSWLASSDWLDRLRPHGMVGANMAISREVLRRVPSFDPELGPGALGFGEEQLFASQMLAAGYRIVGGQDIVVEHHFGADRLSRQAWLDAAERRGRSHAYRGHHWEHWGSRLTRPHLLRTLSALTTWRLLHGERVSSEGCSVEELQLRFRCSMFRAHLNERGRPRNYAFRGLTRLAGPVGRSPQPLAQPALNP